MKSPEKIALKDSPFCKTEIYMTPLFGTHEHNTYQTIVCNTTIIFNIFEFVIIIIFHFHILSKKTFYLGTAFNNKKTRKFTVHLNFSSPNTPHSRITKICRESLVKLNIYTTSQN